MANGTLNFGIGSVSGTLSDERGKVSYLFDITPPLRGRIRGRNTLLKIEQSQ